MNNDKPDNAELTLAKRSDIEAALQRLRESVVADPNGNPPAGDTAGLSASSRSILQTLVGLNRISIMDESYGITTEAKADPVAGKDDRIVVIDALVASNPEGLTDAQRETLKALNDSPQALDIFWSSVLDTQASGRMTDDTTAEIIERLREYTKKQDAPKIVLLGNSLGARNRLVEALRDSMLSDEMLDLFGSTASPPIPGYDYGDTSLSRVFPRGRLAYTPHRIPANLTKTSYPLSAALRGNFMPELNPVSDSTKKAWRELLNASIIAPELSIHRDNMRGSHFTHAYLPSPETDLSIHMNKTRNTQFKGRAYQTRPRKKKSSVEPITWLSVLADRRAADKKRARAKNKKNARKRRRKAKTASKRGNRK